MNSLEEFLRQNLPAATVPDDFLGRIQHSVAAHRRPALPAWALATAAALSILALLGGYEAGRSLSAPTRQEMPIESAMLLLNQ